MARLPGRRMINRAAFFRALPAPDPTLNFLTVVVSYNHSSCKPVSRSKRKVQRI